MNNLSVDIGNSTIKAGIFENEMLVDSFAAVTFDELVQRTQGRSIDHLIVSSVRVEENFDWQTIPVAGLRLRLSKELAVPIRIHYDTPDTLGMDRVAAACGAVSLYPNKDCLVIDMGTCITYDLVTADGSFEGGSIAPGVKMRFKAMHQFTARLPLGTPVTNPPFPGKSTLTGLQTGVMLGIESEINGFVSRYQSRYPHLVTLLCGGDCRLFENTLKPSIFAAPDLILTGLNRILLYNVTK